MCLHLLLIYYRSYCNSLSWLCFIAGSFVITCEFTLTRSLALSFSLLLYSVRKCIQVLRTKRTEKIVSTSLPFLLVCWVTVALAHTRSAFDYRYIASIVYSLFSVACKSIEICCFCLTVIVTSKLIYTHRTSANNLALARRKHSAISCQCK